MSTAMTYSHPGEHLAEFLEEYGISQYRLAKDIHVPPRRINEIVHEARHYRRYRTAPGALFRLQRPVQDEPAIRLRPHLCRKRDW